MPLPQDARDFSPAPHAGSEPLQQELNGGFPWLRFGQPLEREFVAYLRGVQRRTQLVLGVAGLGVLGVFALLDLRRYAAVRGTAHEDLFLWGVFLPRCASLAVLVVAIVVVAGRRRRGALPAPATAAMLALVGLSVFVSTVVYGRLGVPSATSSYLLIIMAVFLPCGLLFRESLALGLFLWACGIAIAHRMLGPGHAEEPWILMVMMTVALVMSVASAYMHEHALRKQFLLGRLLAWKALHDPLTGLANRRMFAAHAARVLAQGGREGVPVALALVDVDHFKRYNDHYGHQAGDAALQQVGALLARHGARPLDLAARLGGEEFGLLAYGEDAASLARRMRTMLAELHTQGIAHAASPTSSVLSASVGVAGAHAGTPVDALHSEADRLLYEAKAAGRDRVAVQGVPS
jgi:diguanylate cyclase (GGDEF)-like protein